MSPSVTLLVTIAIRSLGILYLKERNPGGFRALYWEYLQWANAGLRDEYGIGLDTAALALP